MIRLRKTWGATLFAVLAVCVAHAQQRNALETVVAVNTDGSATCVEKLKLAAPMRHTIHWRLPTASVTPLGVRRLLLVDVLEIADGQDNPIRAQTRNYGGQVAVTVPVQALAGNTVRITYEVRNAVRFRESADELYWPIGRGWSESFEGVAADVTVPHAAAGRVRGQVVSDAEYGGSEPLVIHGTNADFEVASPPDPSRGPAIDLAFAPGVLHEPSVPQRAAWFLQANPIVLFPGVLLAVMMVVRRYFRRGTNSGISIVARYEPPENLPPAESGFLVDGRLDSRDLAAMLLDLSRRGFIRVEAGEPDKEVPYPAPDFVLRLLKPMDDWKGAYPYEHVMLFHTFYGGEWTKLSSVSLRFYAVVPMIRRMIRDELQRKGLYVDPRQVAAQQIAAVLLVAAAMWAAQAAGWFAAAQSGLLALVTVVSLVAIALLLTRRVDHTTLQGARALSDLRGFQMFLDSVEADRMERITPDLYEQYLPYAVALGVEHHWSAAFSTINTGPPLWWDAGKSGGIPDFVHLVGSYAQPPRRAPVSAPPQAKATNA